MTHLTRSDLERIRNGAATGAEARHLAECDECAALMREQISLVESANALRAAFSDPEVRQEPAKFPSRAVWLSAAAATVAAISITALLMRDDPSPTTEVRSPTVETNSATIVSVTPAPKSPWDSLLAEVRRSRKLPLPSDIREFAAEDTFRGGSNDERATRVSPSATAVEDQRPEFRWPRVEGASYSVTVADTSTVVAESPRLETARWRSNVALARGKVYSWQVKIEKADETLVMPAPPSPPALFRIVTATDQAELERARKERPDDHLLLGVLYARAGVVDHARRELEASEDPLAGELLKQLQ